MVWVGWKVGWVDEEEPGAAVTLDGSKVVGVVGNGRVKRRNALEY